MAKDTLSAAGLHYLGVRSLLVSARFIAQCLDMDRRLPVGGPDGYQSDASGPYPVLVAPQCMGLAGLFKLVVETSV